nr:hypothetical protein [Flexibacter flexilis]
MKTKSRYYLEASPANLFQSRENEMPETTTATCGQKCYELSMKSNRYTSWQKTFLESLLLKTDWSSNKYLLTWKVSAITPSYWKFQLRGQAHPTSVSEYGSLPTPRAQMTAAISERRKNDKHRNLEVILSRAILPTPTVNDSYNQGSPSQLKRETINLNCYGVIIGEPGPLNPAFVEIMMGYPTGYTDINLKDLVMP